MRELVITKSMLAQSERSLARYFTDLNKIEMISVQEELVLARRIKAGDEQALIQLVKSNLRFVISVAKQYQHQGAISAIL